MPSSHSNQINEIIKIAVAVQPQSVLDIGVGFGKYGFLMREYLDLAIANECKEGEFTRTKRIDGIEAFPDYIGNLQRSIYDNIFLGDASKIAEELDHTYDLILLIDVFEHFEHEQGLKLLEVLRKKSRNILISTPQHVQEQGAEYGNAFETHQFEWEKKHYQHLPNKTFIDNSYSLIMFSGDDVQKVADLFDRSKQWMIRIKRTFSLLSLKMWISHNLPFIRNNYRRVTGKPKL